MNVVIETDNLVKRYGSVLAVDRVSLKVNEGEIYAFLGLNGAGKTTTIRMLLGMIRPTAGAVRVLTTTIRPGRREPWSEVGYLVETPHPYPELTVTENLEVSRRLHPGTSSQAVQDTIDLLSLRVYADRRAGTLSTGNVQRLGLAKALLHQPRLLILDEPANGLDPAGIVEIRELLRGLARDRGVTIFMSSHILAEVSRLAQRIGIIHEGQLLKELDLTELEQRRQGRLLVKARDLPLAQSALAAAGHTPALLANGAIELADPAAIDHPDEVASLLVRAGAPPTQLLVEQEDLEQYFLRLVGMDGGSHG